jgi:hypothetical protein
MSRKKLKMLFTVAIMCLLLFSQTTNAQITLVHTFNGSVTNNYVQINNPDIDYYVEAYPTTTNQVKIYNKSNFSLYKSVNITPPSNYGIHQTYLFSKNILTTDNKLAFFVMLSNTGNPDYNLRYSLRLYNEDGVLIKDFGYSGTSINPTIHIVNNSYRLLFYRLIYEPFPTSKYETEIYSLPGVAPSPPIITTTTLPNGTIGAEYNVTLTATGTNPITWSLESGNLPNGINLSSTGILSGTPTVSETFDFAVKAANEAGSEKKELFIVIDEETGISTLQIAEMKIYPNPTNGKLFVECGNAVQNRLIFYDMTGKEILNQNITGKAEINIGNLQKGIYIISIVSESEVIGNFKIVKQ